jgi:hypothetical protein
MPATAIWRGLRPSSRKQGHDRQPGAEADEPDLLT